MTASNNPNTIDKNNWYYENKNHLTLVSYDDHGDYPRIIDIPLRMLRASLARIAVKPKKRKAKA
jgi:hypothetical protein